MVFAKIGITFLRTFLAGNIPAETLGRVDVQLGIIDDRNSLPLRGGMSGLGSWGERQRSPAHLRPTEAAVAYQLRDESFAH